MNAVNLFQFFFLDVDSLSSGVFASFCVEIQKFIVEFIKDENTDPVGSVDFWPVGSGFY